MKKVGIIQSNYIPWKGYFDIIHDVDLFIFYDDVQYTKNDWRNRNRIKCPDGTLWLTIPTGTELNRLICEVAIDDTRWARKHFRTLKQYYGKSPHFRLYEEWLEYVYMDRRWNILSELNQYIIEYISHELLGLKTEFADSRDYRPQGRKQDRVMDLLSKAGANLYMSGPAAKDYMDENKFRQSGILLKYKNYAGYPEYPQFHPPFEHGVTIFDLLFNCGPEAPYYIWGWREQS